MGAITLKNMFGITLASCAFFLAGCSTDLYEPNSNPTPELPDSTVFDFSTEKSFTLNVKYDVPEGYNVFFEVYAENPIEVSKYGQISKKDIKPIDVGTTDKWGNYSYKINHVPTNINKLYIYTSYIGVPHLMEAVINGNQLENATVADLTATTRAMALKYASGYENMLYNQFDGFSVEPHRLGYWMNANGYYGRPLYLTSENLKVDAETLRTINNTVPDGKNQTTQHHLDNYLANGDINVGKDSEVWLYFLDEGTGAYSSMGYYCYETNNPPTRPADIEKRVVMAFPHAKKIGNPYNYGALNEGEGIMLHYINADGKDEGTRFPAGTSIGWVIYNNGYKAAAQNGRKLTAKGNGSVSSIIYSSPNLRPDKNTPQVALFRKDQFVALTMEDWYGGTDWDYNDIIFSVSANPIQAILPDIPEAEPEKPATPTTAEYEGILAFEDLWPRQGDFDLNDVVVHYKTEISYTVNNEVEKTEDTYTLLWSGGGIQDAFGYLLKASPADVEITATGGSIEIEQDANGYTVVRLFQDVPSMTKDNTVMPEITVVTKYKKPISKNNVELAPYNPFITTYQKNIEVHLTNKNPSSFAKKEYFGTDDDESIYGQGKYYVTHQRDENGNFTNQQMPFAIHMLGLKKSEFINFEEGKHIDTYYPKFLNWINTKGKEDTDWFKHPIKK